MKIVLAQSALILVVFTCVKLGHCDHVTVETPLGPVQGHEQWSVRQNKFYAFLGIPYAKPPVGPLRFKRPEPVDPWMDTFRADIHPECMQYSTFEMKLRGQEDCLFLSVFTPKLPEKGSKLLPVFFWIHGGGFFMGSGNTDFYGPNRIMDHDVVFVSINYRLGPLGFLSTFDDNMAGNQGLWDQIMALHWVQQNIESFGGDPNQVTIAGESAGSMSVAALYLTRQAKGLFHAGILQSGAPLHPFLQMDKHPSYYTKSLADKVGCDPEANSAKLTECLQSKPGDDLADAIMMFADYPAGDVSIFPFKPIVDGFSSNPLLPEEPLVLIEKGDTINDVPMIIGDNKDEGAVNLLEYWKNSSKIQDHFERWSKVGPHAVFFRDRDAVTKGDLQAMKALNQRFFGNENGPQEMDKFLPGLMDMCTEVHFASGTHYFATHMATKMTSPVYQYIYTHHGSLGLASTFSLPPWKIVLKIFGRYVGLDLFSNRDHAGHGDELFLMFTSSVIPMDGVFSDEDKIASEKLWTLWTDFVKTKNPTPESKLSELEVQWLPVTKTTLAQGASWPRLDINARSLEMKPVDQSVLKFWTTQIWNVASPMLNAWQDPDRKNHKPYLPQRSSKSSKDEL